MEGQRSSKPFYIGSSPIGETNLLEHNMQYSYNNKSYPTSYELSGEESNLPSSKDNSTIRLIDANTKNIILFLIEKDIEAWRNIPKSVIDYIFADDKVSKAFKLIENNKTNIVDILINGVILTWNGSDWILKGIIDNE